MPQKRRPESGWRDEADDEDAENFASGYERIFGYREYLAAYQAADKLKREGMTEDDTRRSVAQPVSTMDADLNRRYCAWAERRLSIQEQAVKDVFVGRPMSYVQK